MDLNTKYRPTTFDEVLGQDAAVRSLVSVIESETPPHAYLFTGPSGVGKTTLARICAKYLGTDKSGLIEFDAASNSGVDDVRKLTETLKYYAFGAEGIKTVIIDECHSLSANAWQALLKTIEEPPDHVYFMLCTTQANKVPKTIKTRCHTYNLLDVDGDTIDTLLGDISAAERIQLPEKARSLLIEAAAGSPRKALVLLSMVRDEKNTAGVKKVLTSEVGASEKQIIDLCRALIFKPDFYSCLDTVKKIKNETVNPEGVRIQVVNYAAVILLSEKKQAERTIRQCLEVISAFSGEFNTSEKWAPVLLACAECTLGE